MLSLPPVVAVTGTDTDVGKTIVTAALAAALQGAGRSVAAYKPAQTGVGPGDEGDMQVVRRLTGATIAEGCRLTEPMAPVPAAEIDGVRLPRLDDHRHEVAALSGQHDHVLVEGAGGLLVELTGARETIADLAGALDAAVIVVVRAALGTLNHTMLTVEALHRRGRRIAGIVIGSWPADPGIVERDNYRYLAALDVPLLGTIPAGAAQRPDFASAAIGWLGADKDANRSG
ncbi:dethiobiotin synthase [Epidermidibacterium keratini]|nr:dethiobiotin synthase [Epidermidibacterium keratini]